MSRSTPEHGPCACGKVTPLYYHEGRDEYMCEDCLDNEAVAAYDRQQEADLESPPESAREEQLWTWAEHQKALKR